MAQVRVGKMLGCRCFGAAHVLLPGEADPYFALEPF